MAIKQIQLRGISRTPSDRMTADGGLAESLNVYLDTSEQAPTLVPEDVTADLGLPLDLRADRIFIHKTINYENYICEIHGRIFAIINGKEFDIVHIETSENLLDIDSIGNILILTTTAKVRYCLYSSQEYKYLGDKIPTPQVRFETIYNNNIYIEEHQNGGIIRLDTSGVDSGHTLISQFQRDVWELAARGNSDFESANEYLKTVNRELWAAIQSQKNTLHRWGLFCCPRLVRYAIRLYDGSYIQHSVPILLGAGANEWISSVRGNFDGLVSTISFQLSNYYKAVAKLINWDIEGWEDVIAGIDIFISTDITFPQINSPFETCKDGGGPIYFRDYKDSFNKVKEEILSKDVFYKVAAFGVRDLDKFKDGVDLHSNEYVGDSSLLVQQPQLTNDYMSNHTVIPAQTQTFNNRLIAKGSQIILPDAPYEMNGLYSLRQSRHSFKFCFLVKKDKTEYEVYAKDTNGSYEFVSPEIPYEDEVYGEVFQHANPYGWIAYPDPDCYKVKIESDYYGCHEIPMAQHPILNCSYAYIGLGNSFLDYEGSQADALSPDDRDNRYKSDNKLLVSETNNPFIFPAKGQFTFTSKILGIAIATAALSQGQFGQFPLYVFTEDGIWVMETAADGSFVSQKPLSREVCVNPDSICAIDNAVVFATAKGVMMIQGAQVTNISPHMNGRHYIPNESAIKLIKGQEGFGKLEPSIIDEEPFMTFVKKAKVAYDYTGQRIIFIAEDETYQYIYKTDTQTWHKMSFDGIDLNTPINSYPECLVQASKELDESPIYLFTRSNPDITIKEVEDLLQDIPNESLLQGATLDLSIASNLHDFLSGKITYVLVPEQAIADDIQEVLEYWGFYINCYYGDSREVKVELAKGDKEEIMRSAEYLAREFASYYEHYPIPSTTPNLLTSEGWKEFASKKKVKCTNCDNIDGLEYALGTTGITLKAKNVQVFLARAVKIYSLSTPLDVSTNQSTAKGIIITRPFNMDNPDVFKTIIDVRARGQFPEGAVKFILQASNDGINWATLSTLRGSSWKLFRLFILADLQPTDRISYIDVQYETKFTNRLR